MTNLHENFIPQYSVTGSSNRAFGFVFTAFFLFLAIWPALSDRPVRLWAIACAAVFLAISLVKPSLLAKPNYWWGRFGLLLGAVVSPIALGILFFGVITPMGFVLRMSGNDPLRLRSGKQLPSYWIVRDPPGPDPDTLVHQF
jgi:hypothetical protein